MEVRVFFEEEQVDRAGGGAQARPFTFAAVLDAHPLEAPGDPRSGADEGGGILARGGEAVMRIVVSGEHAALFRVVGRVPAAGGRRGAPFAGEERLVRIVPAQLVVGLQVIVETEHVARVVHRRAFRRVAHHGRQRAGRVELARAGEQLPGDAPSARLGVQRLLVAHRPEEHAGMVAVAADERRQLLHGLRLGGEPACFRQRQHAVFVQRVHFGLAVRIVRQPHGVRAHLLHQPHAVARDFRRHHLAGQAEILMAVHAVYVRALAVQEERAVGGKADRAEAEARGLGIEDFSVFANCHAAGIQLRVGQPPQRGSFDAQRQRSRADIPFGHPRGRFAARGERSLPVQNFGAHGQRPRPRSVVFDFHVHRHAPEGAFLLFGMHEHAVGRDARVVCDDELHVAIDAHALIPPALIGGRGIHAHADGVLAAEAREARNVHVERRVAAERAPGQTAVHVHLGMRRHALKAQVRPRAVLPFGQGEAAAIPAAVIAEIAQPLVALRPGRAADQRVVRQRHRRERAVVVFLRRRPPQAALGLRLHVHRALVVRRAHGGVAVVVFPAVVQKDGFSHICPSAPSFGSRSGVM